MKNICLILLISIVGCSKFEVVSRLDVHMYHMQNPKTKQVEVILSKDTLEVGKFYNLKRINIIDSPYYSRPKLKNR